MKHSIVLLLAAIFCFGSLPNASAAAPTMDRCHYHHWHHWHHWHHHHWYYWHHYHHWHHWHHHHW